MNKVQDVNIILIDADDRVRGYLRSMLYRYGFANIQEVGSGDKALQAISLASINLVFLDTNVAGANGFELIQDIKKIQPKCQIIVTSTGVTKDLVDQITDAHIKMVVLKPFSNRTIETKVQQVLPILYKTSWPIDPNLSTASNEHTLNAT